MYAWIDLETTGLSTDCDILEFALVITDENFDIVEEMDWVVHPSPNFVSEPYAINMHQKSGLLDACLAKDVSVNIGYVDIAAAVMLGEHVWKDELYYPAGSSVHFDVGFVKKYMPFTAKYLSHRILDVSTLKLFFASAFGLSPDDLPPKKSETKHRAMSDIHDSLEAAIWYKENCQPVYTFRGMPV